MTLEEKLELLKLLLERNTEVRTCYRNRHITALEKTGNHIVIRYENGDSGRIRVGVLTRQHCDITLGG